MATYTVQPPALEKVVNAETIVRKLTHYLKSKKLEKWAICTPQSGRHGLQKDDDALKILKLYMATSDNLQMCFDFIKEYINSQTDGETEGKQKQDDIKVNSSKENHDKLQQRITQLEKENKENISKIRETQTEISNVRADFDLLTQKKYEEDIAKLKIQLESQKQDIKKKEETIQKLDNQLQQRKDSSTDDRNTTEISRIKTKLNQHIQQIEKLKVENKELLETSNNLQIMVDDNADVSSLRKQIQDLTHRLAREMSEKVAKDESSLEYVSILCRPMNVAVEYQLLCTNSWLEAKTIFSESKFKEKEACLFLKDILILSCKEASKIFDGALQLIQHIHCDPVQVIGELLEGTVKIENYKAIMSQTDKTQLSDVLISYIGDSFRQTVGKSDLSYLVKLIMVAIEKKYQTIGKHLKAAPVEIYIKEACTLGWKMAIHRPPMTYSEDDQGKKWKGTMEETQELQWGSEPSKTNASIQYYVHPIMKHDGKVMAKGKVYVNG